MVTRYDTKYTSASKSYDRGFNLADGAAVTAYQDMKNSSPEILEARLSPPFTDPNNIPPAVTVGCPCVDWTQCKTATARKACNKCIDSTVGDYTAQEQLMGYSTKAQASVGWEAGTYYAQYWSGYGTGNPTNSTAYSTGVETDVQKISPTK